MIARAAALATFFAFAVARSAHAGDEARNPAVESLEHIRAVVAGAPAEPEPPPGLRAPADSERHHAARAAYDDAMASWRRARDAHLNRVLDLCTRHLDRFPLPRPEPAAPEAAASEPGTPSRQVAGVRAAVAFELRRWALARSDWEACLAAGVEDLGPARALLVEACRRLGDYRAALRHGGDEDPDPDLLEEAGRIGAAIRAARARGLEEKARDWERLGKEFEGAGRIPQFDGVRIVESGEELHPSTRKALLAVFVGKIRIFSFSGGRSAIYLLDSSGIVRAVNPRIDTLHHRVTQLLNDR